MLVHVCDWFTKRSRLCQLPSETLGRGYLEKISIFLTDKYLEGRRFGYDLAFRVVMTSFDSIEIIEPILDELVADEAVPIYSFIWSRDVVVPQELCLQKKNKLDLATLSVLLRQYVPGLQIVDDLSHEKMRDVYIAGSDGLIIGLYKDTPVYMQALFGYGRDDIDWRRGVTRQEESMLAFVADYDYPLRLRFRVRMLKGADDNPDDEIDYFVEQQKIDVIRNILFHALEARWFDVVAK